jgi:hypothetical protein
LCPAAISALIAALREKRMNRKTIISRLAKSLLVLLLLAAPAAVQAQFTYLVEGGQITITGDANIPADGVVLIPSTILVNGVTLPVTGIGDNAFGGTPLTSVTIPDSVTTIGNGAFSYCPSMTNVMIGSSAASIGTDEFLGCTDLAVIAVDDFNPFYSSLAGVLFNKNQTTLISFPGGKAGSYTIPGTVTNIAEAAFEGCVSLTSITFPGSVISLEYSSFQNCTSLTAIAIPDSVTSIEDLSFADCTGLTNVTIGSGVTNEPNDAFIECSSLVTINVDSSNYYYSSVEGVLFDKNQATLLQYPAGRAGGYTIPDGVNNVGDYAFAYSYKLNNVTIPDSVTNIGASAFFVCGLTNVTIGNGVTSIGDSAFFQCRMTDVNIPDSVTSIGESAFYQCIWLTSITIPDSVTNIAEGAFGLCSSLTGIAIPDGITSLADGLFENCTSLSSVTIPNSVSSIGDGAFANCTSLTSITIPAGVSSIGFGLFAGCAGLAGITVDASNSYYSSSAGVLFDKNQTTLIQYPANKTGNYAIPAGVTSIGDEAFYQCTRLTSVTIPAGVTNMGEYAFFECPLTSITIPDTVTSIGDSAFIHCLFTNVTIPAGITNIGDYAFSYCAELYGVYFKGNAPNLGSETFFDDNKMTIYYLPETTGWDEFSATTGLPVLLWNPQVEIDSSFGVQSNQFGFNITGPTNVLIVVEACTNLADPVWSPVGTNSLIGGSSHFSDPKWMNYPSRFYRFSSP